MTVHQIVYSSDSSKKMLKSDLYIILRTSRMNNKSLGVTGLLVYCDKKFFQVLEGPRDVVAQLFEKISIDDRHFGVRTLSAKDVPKRAFESWEMAYATPSANELANWAGLQNTTTVKGTIERLQSKPSLLSEFLENILNNSVLD